jgi:protein-S-isoprenylcysteine O-methyltransferase Ste14
VGTAPGSVVRTFFILLALVVVCLPIVGWLASSHSVQWGTVPEWIGALSLVLIAVGVWSVARNGERERDRSDHLR